MNSLYEAVCVCGHAQDEHPGRCDRCQEPPCAFFVLRFHRVIVPWHRWTGPDPVGHYWRLMAPRGSDAWIFSHLSEADRKEVMSICFNDAQFDDRGDLKCVHPFRGVTYEQFRDKPWLYYRWIAKARPWCEEEYLCEVIAAFILMRPGVYLASDDEEVAAKFDCEPWAVRFRRVLEETTDPEVVRMVVYSEKKVREALGKV